MNILLSWNLFILAVCILIVAYSYIIGLNKTVKMIIATYLAILASDGLGNIISQHLLEAGNVNKVVELVSTGNHDELIISLKVIIFAVVVVLLTIKGSFSVKINPNQLFGGNLFINGIFGIVSSGLIVSTLLMYVSGKSLIQKVSLNSNIIDLYADSQFVKYMIDFYDFWFAVPVILIIVVSIFSNRGADTN